MHDEGVAQNSQLAPFRVNHANAPAPEFPENTMHRMDLRDAIHAQNGREEAGRGEWQWYWVEGAEGHWQGLWVEEPVGQGHCEWLWVEETAGHWEQEWVEEAAEQGAWLWQLVDGTGGQTEWQWVWAEETGEQEEQEWQAHEPSPSSSFGGGDAWPSPHSPSF